MTLQERMIAVYLRQAKLPPEEKDKLKLFLGLLLETLEEEEPWEQKMREDASAEQSRAEQSRAEQSRAEQSPPPETPATTFSVDPETPDGAASTSSAPVHGVDENTANDPFSETLMEVMEKSSNDPFAEALLEALDKLGLKLDSKEAEKYFGVRCSVLQKALLGKSIRKDSRARILQRVQDAGIAVTA